MAVQITRQKLRIAWSVLPLAVLLAMWLLAAWQLGPARLPAPLPTLALLLSSISQNPIIATQGGGSFGYFPHIMVTLVRVLVGVCLGSSCGLIVALACSSNAILLEIQDVFVELGRALPPLLFVPLAAVVFGASDAVEFISIAVYSGTIFTLYAAVALANVPHNYVELGRLLGAGWCRVILTIKLPAIVPALVGASRIAFSYGIGIAIVAEYLVSSSGIGRVMKYSLAYSDVGLIVVGVVWAVAISFICDALTVLLFGLFTRGNRRQDLMQWLSVE